MPGTSPQTVCLLEMRKNNPQTPKSNPFVSRHGVGQPEIVSNWEVWHVRLTNQSCLLVFCCGVSVCVCTQVGSECFGSVQESVPVLICNIDSRNFSTTELKISMGAIFPGIKRLAICKNAQR
jgi:hypothetical protein